MPPPPEIIELGNLYPSEGQNGNVFSIHGIAPCQIACNVTTKILLEY